ncbi:hypothetical protein NSA45_11230 [Paraclostridium bifermentans]|uniref:hypothetical protein n=1 Tax=Paraclostridium bifermentans TaxID=1490 RepID=UPI00214A6309|nr:hypothetical protein [Paraclostridium bifermentans]MCR1876442.1 hypothetical protein [Paraclostridium bifermentans]
MTGSTKVAIDCAFITLFFNFIAQVVNDPGQINIELRNNSDVDSLQIRSGRKSKIKVYIDIDYKYKWIKKKLETYGGLQLEIINTSWTSIEIDKREEYGDIIDYTNPSKKIVVDLNNVCLEEQLDGKFYLTLIVESNKTIKSDGVISTKVVQNRTNFVKNLIFNVFIDTTCGCQKLSYREEDE